MTTNLTLPAALRAGLGLLEHLRSKPAPAPPDAAPPDAATTDRSGWTEDRLRDVGLLDGRRLRPRDPMRD